MNFAHSTFPIRHAFLLNCHADVRQALHCTELLRRYWSERSRIFLYIDGRAHTAADLERLRQQCDLVHVAPYQAEKCQSIIDALNFLVEHAARCEIEVGSFLHADMIPTDHDQFYRFVQRFHDSGKLLTFTPMWPDAPVLDFCNLHFRIPAVRAAMLFPVSRCQLPPNFDFNENQVSLSFHRVNPYWKENSYLMWTLVEPYLNQYRVQAPDGTNVIIQKRGHMLNGSFTVHNFTPESTVIHTNDPWFWNNYEIIARLPNAAEVETWSRSGN